MMFQKFRKKILCFALTFSVMAWLCPDLHVSATSANHTHVWGSHEWVECVLFVDHYYDYYPPYEEGGHIFIDREITEWCRFYKQCYCGQRGEYREGGRTRVIRVLIKE